MLSAWLSATRNAASEVVVSPGNVPLCPAPDHDTVQRTVADTAYALPGLPAEEDR
ncbi:hypothetical protein AB0G73_30595 [Streptomyces sp. NPDC020719]|uniref:hypothetical protein n=1 Tax=Streptomyces sp. NPDC020719 TaxID=3154896 RepID=UPI0033F33AA0